jgi:hypothetical protein
MFDFLRPLNFGHRLTLYRLVIALFISGLIYWAFFIPKSGDRAMHRAGLAVQQAKSWKAQWTNTPIGGDFKLEYLVEVSCPSSSRVTEHTLPDPGSRRPEGASVDLNIDGTAYEYHTPENVWKRKGAGRAIYTDECGVSTANEETSLLPPFRKFGRRAVTGKREVREVVGEQCQDWSVVIFYNTNSPTDNYKVCLGVDDDLPRSYSARGMDFRFFDWDVPINFTAPEVAEQPKL